VPSLAERLWPFPIRDCCALAALVIAGALLSTLGGGSFSYGLLLIAFAVALVSPTAAVSAIAVAIPFVQDPVAIGGSRWSLLELAILAAAVSVGVATLREIASTRTLRATLELVKPWSTTVVAAALIVVGSVSLLTVADPRYRPDSVRELRWVIVEPILALFLFRWINRRGGRRMLVTAFIATGVAVAVGGAIQLLTGSGVVIADGVQRATGPYQHPNNLALYLERVVVFALGLAAATMFRKRLFVAVSAVTLIGLAATLSRGAALAFFAGAGWVAATTRIRHGWRWIGAGAIAAFALIAILGVQRLTDTGASGATSSRELIWSSSVEMIRDHPVTGVGLDQFLNQYGRRYVEPAGWSERYTSHPHNLVLDFWLRLGIPGLVCLGALIAVTTRQILAGRQNRIELGNWAGASGALLAGAVHGMVDNGFFLPDLAVSTWLLIAILESTVPPVGKESKA
jgi:putative inorganic carbon (HCO3(-)) transporter